MWILLIEDHRDCREVIARLLRGSGFDVETADSCAAAQAVAASMNWLIDVVIGDVGLPDGDGAQLLRCLRDRCGCYTIALTGHCMTWDEERYNQLGIDACVHKPVTADHLLEALFRAVQIRAAAWRKRPTS